MSEEKGEKTFHDFPEDILSKIATLKKKYASMGQDLGAYLEGLIHADYLTYWDYIQLDTLLSLQNPRTAFPDEHIFIMYHQITELYFKLSLHELKQLAQKENLTADFLKIRIKRVNNYFKALTTSFEIMINGMEKEQFLQFRMALLPASGFQSAQYRMIEICATDFKNLIDKDYRSNYVDMEVNEKNISKMYEFIYWKKGATELATGEKTLTLKQFEQKYSKRFMDLALEYADSNLWALYSKLSKAEKQDQELIDQLRFIDVNVNINWPLSHYKSAARYLQKDPEDIAATGGTNWQKYLPPRFQKRIFYPELWSNQEKEEWGKAWVEETLFFKK